jgi:Protein of unknown function (DUF2786)
VTDDARQRAIARARKLLAQAEHANTSVAERQTFAAKAAEIMMRHDLTEAVVRASAEPTSAATEQIDIFVFRVSGSGGHGRQRAWGLGDVAQAYGCEVCFFDNNASNAPRTVHIVGATTDLDTLRMLLATVAAVAETTAAEAARRHRQSLSSEGWYTPAELDREVTLYRRSFLRSFGAGVAAQIRAQRETLVQELATTTGTGAELVLVDRAARINAAFARRYPKLGKPSRVRARSDTGARDGFTAGQAMNLGGNALDADQPRRQLPN